MKVELPLGDVVDKVTILLIKEERIADPAKLDHVRAELSTLRSAWAEAGYPPMETLAAWDGLRTVNGQLWEIEDELRDLEREQDFGPRFIELARAVYKTNDRRARLKAEINAALGSRLVEQKSYRPYEA